MSGALTELSAKGVQDSYLTGANADITFFKSVFRKHTNFAREAVEIQPRSGDGWGKEVTFEIARNGDLVTKMWVVLDLPKLPSGAVWANPIGYNAIEYAEVSIGGQRFDRHYGEYMYAWNQLTQASDTANNEMVGLIGGSKAGGHTNVGVSSGSAHHQFAQKKNRLYIPLSFWFNQHLSMALPLIALQFHQVHIKIKLRERAAVARATTATATAATIGGGVSLGGAFANYQASVDTYEAAVSALASPSFEDVKTTLLVDYIYLDSAERRLFAGAAEHEYLIETVQHSGPSTVTSGSKVHSEKLNFNHPCKQLIFMVRPDAHKMGNNPLDFRGTDCKGGSHCELADETEYAAADGPDCHEGFSEMTLKFNGHDRFKARDNSYFRVVQANQHMQNIPDSKIYSYSFALDPMSWLPSGSVNFSRVDTVQMVLTSNSAQRKGWETDGTRTLAAAAGFQQGELLTYARTYNVVKIVSGMAGVKYAN